MKLLHRLEAEMTLLTRLGMRTGVCGLLLAALLSAPPMAAAAEQKTFASPEAAVDALVAALAKNDEAALIAIFGEAHKTLVVTDDSASDAFERSQAAAALAAFRALDARGEDRRVLLMGAQAWPAPIPLVRQGGAWRFATEEGIEEILNRRIGGNERSAIHVLRSYLEAQRLYASQDRDGDGVLQYARKLASAPGKRDGLYWPADPSDDGDVSPFGPLIAESSAYLGDRKAGDPYRGYHFRILTRQGKNAAGGEYDYVINGRMIAGFAMVAYPADYGASGVMSFIVNHNGKIFEKDLGERTHEIAPQVTRFDPRAGWKEVTP